MVAAVCGSEAVVGASTGCAVPEDILMRLPVVSGVVDDLFGGFVFLSAGF